MSILNNQRPNCFGVLIPCYNNNDTLARLLTQIESKRRLWFPHKEKILVVDDGSEPSVAATLKRSRDVRIIRIPENRGKGAALKTGFRHFLKNREVSCVITLDADLQHPPEFISGFLNKYFDKKADLVMGCRKISGSEMPWERKCSNKLSSLIISFATGRRITDSQCGYRLYSRKLLQQIPLKEDRFHLESEALIRSCWNKYRIENIPIPTIYQGERSSIHHVADTLNFLAVILRTVKERVSGNV